MPLRYTLFLDGKFKTFEISAYTLVLKELSSASNDLKKLTN